MSLLKVGFQSFMLDFKIILRLFPIKERHCYLFQEQYEIEPRLATIILAAVEGANIQYPKMLSCCAGENRGL